MTLMLAAASIKVMDALFGLVARNDAECCKRELLRRPWRRLGHAQFSTFLPTGKKIRPEYFCSALDAAGVRDPDRCPSDTRTSPLQKKIFSIFWNVEKKVGILPRECVVRNQRPRFGIGKEKFL